ncbi:Stress response protein NST1-like protein 1 [Colletotrichum chlorophyti]|uniref:Stress response protein NST1 n=1 Tax=Colletotrichum chlorophyti TaxID=708187 RepID=A0A1Q8S733_9PEZI|nr:Stress response protein NST1-like protein 1 [Colletotrichum chlorophyti]
MPANTRQPAPQTPASPNTKATARYTNKDGSKIITVPKGSPSTEPSLPSTPTSSAKPPSLQTVAANGGDAPAPAVNRKKQKRRAKAAAKAAAEQAASKPPNGRSSPAPGVPAPKSQASQDDVDQDSSDDDADDHLDEDHLDTNGIAPAKSKKSKRKKKKNGKNPQLANPTFDNVPHPHSPLAPHGPGISKDKIWNTSSQEERERIKEFWLGLGENERKSLVKVEKDAVLKKMKEQQKHTCSCTVCGRKRTAIEEELEGLYDAYYHELETFAHNGDGPPLLTAARDFPLRPSRLPSGYSGHPPSRGRIVEHVGDDDEEEEEDPDEEYSDEEDELEEDEEEEEEEEYSDEDEPPEDAHPHDRDVADFLTFGNSLQVKGMKLLDSLLCRYGNMDLGGILTVADDLLKNDGKRFIEMMEQLAERRMAREEDAKEHFSRSYGHPANGAYSNHNHPPPEDDYDDEDEEEDEDYDDSQEEEYEDEEVSSSQYTYDHKHSSTEHYCCHHQDTMTEQQRMEEGRRMFQIFAARMFEQRVLTAYRDMVAKQRQQQLLEELEEENRQDAQRKAKKAKENQKRKERAAQKKQQQAEEKAAKEAEKAAEEAARLEEQRKKAEQQKLKAEEKRRKKEEQKRLEEEERLRKEAERQKRLQEQQEKRAEQDRKAREAKEKAQKAKEEARLREKEIREQKERESRERKEKQEQARRDKEAKAKAEREAKAEKESKERLQQEEKAAQKTATISAAPIPIPNQQGRRLSQHPIPTATHPSNPASYASPKIPVATPALPKAPTPIRPKHASQPLETSVSGSQASHSSSTASQNPSPHPATPGHTSPALFGSRKGSLATATSLPHPQSVSPSSVKGPMQPGPFGMPMSMPPPGFPVPPPGLANRLHEPVFGPPGIAGFGRPPPGMMPGPPGLNGPAGRGFIPPPPPGFGQPMGDPLHSMAPGPVTHSRQASGSFDSASSPAPSQPIGRPAPIGRPSSVVQGQRSDQPDDFSDQHLGSSALLDDSEDPITAAINAARQRNQAPRPAFPNIPFGMDNGFHGMSNVWGPSAMPFPPPGLSNPTWGSPMMAPLPSLNQIRTVGNPRSVTVRLLLCNACKELQARNTEAPDAFVDLATIKAEVDQLSRMEAISEEDLLALAETEGNALNGGGTFDIQRDASGPGKHSIRWVPEFNDVPQPHHRAVGAPGEIGSPIIGSGAPAYVARGH